MGAAENERDRPPGDGGSAEASAEARRRIAHEGTDAMGTPTPPPELRSDAIARELAALMREAVIVVARESQPPGAQRRDSLPVRAARSLRPAAREGYKLTRLGLALVGFIVVVAEALAADHAVARAVLRALLARAGD